MVAIANSMMKLITDIGMEFRNGPFEYLDIFLVEKKTEKIKYNDKIL